MHLRRLAIRSLPGIEPGFSFEPPDAGITVVTGPNAIGKSSLARALKYLLAPHGSDPPALSLEADFEGGDARWQVSRNGNQVLWRRNGEVVSRPALPAADQIGLFRLSVEHLLDDDDANDKALAGRLWRELHGNFDLGQPRIVITLRFARYEAGKLAEAANERRRVEREYAGLQRREAALPDVERRIEQAVAAEARRDLLEQALKLADAIDARKARESALQGFPPDMDRLRGDELRQLEENDARVRRLHEELRSRQRDIEVAETDLERTGFSRSAPVPEEVRAANERLRQLGEQSVERRNSESALVETGAALRDVLARFDREGKPPRLGADVLRRAEEIAGPLIAAQVRRRELKEVLALTGEAPESAEVERQRGGVEALRAWLAGRAAGSDRTPAKLPRLVASVALAVVGFAALVAFAQGAPVASAAALAALVIFVLALYLVRGPRSKAPSPTDEAMRRFGETGLAPPSQWTEQAVREHLREVVEVRLNELTLQQVRASGSDRIRLQIDELDADIERLEEDRFVLAREIGFDPLLPVAEFQRFVRLCSDWDTARIRHLQQRAGLEVLDRTIADGATLVRDFLAQWRTADAPSLDEPAARGDVVVLRAAFDDLQQRHQAAVEARHRMRDCKTAIRLLKQQIADIDDAQESLFVRAGLEACDRTALAARIELLPQWREAKGALDTANTEEALVRARLEKRHDLIVLAVGGDRARLQADHAIAAREAGEYTSLIEQRTEIETRLHDAGRDRRLEQAVAAEDRARRELEDKRDEALLATATATLLDDVEQAFVAEHEPAVLRRARDVFAQVTARGFDLQLRDDGTFIAHDVRQGAARTLSELSSGTRMQLLLALRMAWIEMREQGGETLPLFLDEALTTSDEARFAVVAQSLERLSGSGIGTEGGTEHRSPGGEEATRDASANGVRAAGSGAGAVEAVNGSDDGVGSVRRRQIFYLSARRHEPALWQQATGARPMVIDLAAVRFPSQVPAPEDYRVEVPPPLPPPNGRSAEEYASVLGVPPRLDPHRPEGGIHVFHLLRDDLTLLHTLMDTWRIDSLGQLEVLLASDAAHTAIPTEALHHRLRQRGRVVRTWVELWRQGRGRPIDRGVLERCPAVSTTFIDRIAQLAARVGGDGEALVQALRAGEVGRFRSRKREELEQWLADEGYTNDQQRLNDEDRRRLTLQRTAPETAADAADVNRVVSWLEPTAATGDGVDDTSRASGEGLGI